MKHAPDIDLTPHFNRLTPAESERLAMLAEECAEVIQIVGKILRHGYGSHNPDKPEAGDNRDQLAREIGDLRAAVERMVISDDLSEGQMMEAQREKYAKASRYMHHLG